MIMSEKLMNRMIYGVIILFCLTPLLIFILHEYNRINAVGHDG